MPTAKDIETMEAIIAKLWAEIGKGNPRADLALIYCEAALASLKLLRRTAGR